MGAPVWSWQQLRVENDDHGAPELWCHPACRVGQCVVVFSQAPSGRAPLSPSLNSRPSPISATPPPLGPDPPPLRSQSPVRSGAAGVVLGAAEEVPCVNGRWGTLRPPLTSSSVPSSSLPQSRGAAAGGLASTSSSSSPPQASQGAAADGHSIPPIARRLGHHPPQSLNVGKPLYQSLNCKPMQMYVLDVSRAKVNGIVTWKVYGSGGAPPAVMGPPETSLHTVVQGRGELIIFGGLMDKKQNVKYYPKTNALYFVRAKR
ncbi:hypothetical protein Z043_125775 [Scleropages formosus]|uniref:F-box only protein 42 n=1 Tax=Scleropages formosus TaxID=113540 RepID=A0A0P7UCX2_SCLFO|nr:hypothetical protein Z043_125775 [Scleropages formosus]